MILAYLKFVSMAFQRTMAYRVEYYTGLLNAFLYIFIFTSVWKALIPEGGSMSGLTRNDMVAYAVLSTLIKTSFARHEGLLSSRIRSGEIAVDLMKPYNLPLMYFCDTSGVSLFQLFARSLPILFFSFFVFQISLPVDLPTLLGFLPIYALAFILFFSLSFFISSLAFFFVDIFPFWIAYFALITLTSGAIIPLDFFPAAIRGILNYTPFPYLFYVPTMFLLQKSLTIGYPAIMAIYSILIATSMSIGIFTYLLGLKKLSIAGG